MRIGAKGLRFDLDIKLEYYLRRGSGGSVGGVRCEARMEDWKVGGDVGSVGVGCEVSGAE